MPIGLQNLPSHSQKTAAERFSQPAPSPKEIGAPARRWAVATTKSTRPGERGNEARVDFIAFGAEIYAASFHSSFRIILLRKELRPLFPLVIPRRGAQSLAGSGPTPSPPKRSGRCSRPHGAGTGTASTCRRRGCAVLMV